MNNKTICLYVHRRDVFTSILYCLYFSALLSTPQFYHFFKPHSPAKEAFRNKNGIVLWLSESFVNSVFISKVNKIAIHPNGQLGFMGNELKKLCFLTTNKRMF